MQRHQEERGIAEKLSVDFFSKSVGRDSQYETNLSKNGYTKNQKCGNIYKKLQLRSQKKTRESRHCVVVKPNNQEPAPLCPLPKHLLSPPARHLPRCHKFLFFSFPSPDATCCAVVARGEMLSCDVESVAVVCSSAQSSSRFPSVLLFILRSSPVACRVVVVVAGFVVYAVRIN